jgi:hypothetical protein
VKARVFASILSDYADFLGCVGAAMDRRRVRALATVFEQSPTTTVAVLVKRLLSAPASGALGGVSLDEIGRAMVPLSKLFASAAKKAVIADLNAVGQVLSMRSNDDLNAVVSGIAMLARRQSPKTRSSREEVREELVEKYEAALESNLRSPEGFQTTVDALSSPNTLSAAELKQLAKRLSGKGGRSAEDAINNIWGHHRSAMRGAARVRATGGRSAA